MKLSRLVYDPIGRPLVPLETMKPQKADWEILSLPGPVPLRFKNPDGTPTKAEDYVMLKKNNPGTPLALDYDMSTATQTRRIQEIRKSVKQAEHHQDWLRNEQLSLYTVRAGARARARATLMTRMR